LIRIAQQKIIAKLTVAGVNYREVIL